MVPLEYHGLRSVVINRLLSNRVNGKLWLKGLRLVTLSLSNSRYINLVAVLVILVYLVHAGPPALPIILAQLALNLADACVGGLVVLLYRYRDDLIAVTFWVQLTCFYFKILL